MNYHFHKLNAHERHVRVLLFFGAVLVITAVTWYFIGDKFDAAGCSLGVFLSHFDE